MKILHIIGSLAGGGAERLVAQLAPRMNGADSQCEVLALSGNNAVYMESLREAGVKVHIAPYQSRYDFRLLFYLGRMIQKGNYDVVHAHTFPAFYWTALAAYCFRCKAKFLMTEHSTFNRRRDMPLLKPLEKLIYRRYDAVISISEDTQRMLLQWLKPKTAQKYITIENGIDLELFKNATPLSRKELLIPPEVCLLGMAGSFTEHKNHKTFVRALPLLPQNVHAAFAGEGPLKDEAVALADSLGIRARAHFLGFRRDVERVIKTVDIVVIPSLWEGFGLVAAEAMACGKPVAASDVPGVREVIGDCGLLFDPTNTADMANKISSFWVDEELRARCVAHASVRVKRYGIEKMAMNYMRVADQLCGGETL